MLLHVRSRRDSLSTDYNHVRILLHSNYARKALATSLRLSLTHRYHVQILPVYSSHICNLSSLHILLTRPSRVRIYLSLPGLKLRAFFLLNNGSIYRGFMRLWRR
jgi:hypothetical protein